MGKSNVVYLYTGVLFNCHKGVLKIVTTKDPLKEANHKGPHILLFYLY